MPISIIARRDETYFLSPVNRGEGGGEGRSFGALLGPRPLTLTLSPVYRGEGTGSRTNHCDPLEHLSCPRFFQTGCLTRLPAKARRFASESIQYSKCCRTTSPALPKTAVPTIRKRQLKPSSRSPPPCFAPWRRMSRS